MATPASAEPYIMLEVNGEGIKASEVESHWKRLFPDGNAPAFETTAEGIRHNILRAIVSERLLLQAAEDAETDETDSFKEKLEEARQQLLIAEFLRNRGEAVATDRALNRAYLRYVQARKKQKEYRASHILLESEEKANEIHKRLEDGAGFTPLAREYSRDPGSAAQGGDLGYFTATQMVKPFANAVKTLDKDAISKPVETQFGWHIIKLNETRIKEAPSLESVRPQLENQIRQQNVTKKLEEMVAAANVTRTEKEAVDTTILDQLDLLGE